MSMKATTKTLIMFIVTSLASLLYSNGIPETKTAWIVLGVTLVGTMLGYIAKNYFMPSNSEKGQWNLRDIISGVLVAVSVGISNWLGTYVAGTAFDGKAFTKLLITVVIGYLAKTFINDGSNLNKQ